MASQTKLQVISQRDFSNKNFEFDEYTNYEFENCTITDISNIGFSQCTFTSCNLSNCKLHASKLQNVTFRNCKLIGVNFYQAKDFAFEIHLENCLTDYASFDSKKLNSSTFKHCKMHEVNFSNADLSKCRFLNCDVQESVFNHTNLSGLDLTSMQNFLIDPEINITKYAKINAYDLERLLNKYELNIQ
ncbi:MAG: pentapeptide repeat-containing protein [Bacteroidia bacterium]|nr:pentapeptide repeat-containing protein [Bacteroidia bacterium]